MSMATSLFGWLDRPAAGFYGESFKQVLITFALARTVAVISVAQDTDVDVHPVGIGIIGVGEVLDPVNDMVERFSQIMVLSATSLVQRLLEVSKWWPVTAALLVLGLAYLFSIWFKKGTVDWTVDAAAVPPVPVRASVSTADPVLE